MDMWELSQSPVLSPSSGLNLRSRVVGITAENDNHSKLDVERQ